MNEQSQSIKVETEANEVNAFSIEKVTELEEEAAAPASFCCCCCSNGV